jgi:uncharacterized damage-inducible protein DinB
MLSRDEIVQILSRTPERLHELGRRFSPEQLRRGPDEGEWSLNDVLAHLRACADVWEAAIERMLTEDHPTIRAINPRSWIESTDYPDRPFAESRSRFIAQRQAFLQRLERLSDDDWNRSATVTGAGAPLERTVWAYLNRFARHERQHDLQLRSIAVTLAEE